jgi:hypothetical protein
MVGLAGEANGDVIRQFEGLIGSSFNDVLFGDAGGNSINGGWR